MTYRTWVPPLMIGAALAAASCTGTVGVGAPQALPTIVEPTVRPVGADPQSPPVHAELYKGNVWDFARQQP